MSKILVVDDDSLILSAMQSILDPSGYTVITTTSGRAAIDLYCKEPTELVITDLHMPQMSGLEVIKALKTEFPDVTILAMSGGGNPSMDSLSTALASGASDIIRKPFTANELLLIVRQLINTEQ